MFVVSGRIISPKHQVIRVGRSLRVGTIWGNGSMEFEHREELGKRKKKGRLLCMQFLALLVNYTERLSQFHEGPLATCLQPSAILAAPLHGVPAPGIPPATGVRQSPPRLPASATAPHTGDRGASPRPRDCRRHRDTDPPRPCQNAR
jgi:hypothetical protein